MDQPFATNWQVANLPHARKVTIKDLAYIVLRSQFSQFVILVTQRPSAGVDDANGLRNPSVRQLRRNAFGAADYLPVEMRLP